MSGEQARKLGVIAVIWILLLLAPYWMPPLGGYTALGTRVLVLGLAAMSVNFLLGFTGVAYHVGGLLQARFEQLRARPYVATFVGILAILSPLLLARVVGLTGQLGIVTSLLVAVGVVAEYIAWTTGLGAAALVRFGRQAPGPAAPAASLAPQ